MDRLQTNEVSDLRRELTKLKETKQVFSKYELEILREAIIDYRATWDDQVEGGADVSERFMKTIALLEDRLYDMIGAAK